MPPPSHLLLHLLELGQQAVTPGFPFEQEFPVATDCPQMKVKPRKLKVSGFPSPR